VLNYSFNWEREILVVNKQDYTSPFQSAPAPGHLGRRVSRHPQGPERTLHSILRPRVSGTQLLFHSNHAGPETALGKQKTRVTSPFWLAPAPGHLGEESEDTPKVPRGQLLRQTPFWAPDIRAPSLPEERCPQSPGKFCQRTWRSHLGSWIPLRLVCASESIDYRS
jgi:hypothetical protein